MAFLIRLSGVKVESEDTASLGLLSITSFAFLALLIAHLFTSVLYAIKREIVLLLHAFMIGIGEVFLTLLLVCIGTNGT